jgi:hypothetical protein
MSRPDDSNPQLERLLAGYAGSELRSIERAFAAASPCPAAEELRRLDGGLIHDAERRFALARHLLACPRCLERNLAFLAPDEERLATAAPVRSGWMLFGKALAAALLIGVAIGLHTSGREPAASPFHGAYLVDSFGLELREIPDAAGPSTRSERRVLVEPRRGGIVALARLTASGVKIEPIDGDKLVTTIDASHELVLPLHGAVEIERAEHWLVLYSSSRTDGARSIPSEAELRDIAVQLARGYLVSGWSATRVVVPARDVR